MVIACKLVSPASEAATPNATPNGSVKIAIGNNRPAPRRAPLIVRDILRVLGFLTIIEVISEIS